MKSYNQTITWYNPLEIKPKATNKMVILLVGAEKDFSVELGYWDKKEKGWFLRDDNHIPGVYVLAWAYKPKVQQFT
jgi:hypothetical protein